MGLHNDPDARRARALARLEPNPSEAIQHEPNPSEAIQHEPNPSEAITTHALATVATKVSRGTLKLKGGGGGSRRKKRRRNSRKKTRSNKRKVATRKH
jgi:hypothetical protein